MVHDNMSPELLDTTSYHTERSSGKKRATTESKEKDKPTWSLSPRVRATPQASGTPSGVVAVDLAEEEGSREEEVGRQAFLDFLVALVGETRDSQLDSVEQLGEVDGEEIDIPDIVRTGMIE